MSCMFVGLLLDFIVIDSLSALLLVLLEVATGLLLDFIVIDSLSALLLVLLEVATGRLST